MTDSRLRQEYQALFESIKIVDPDYICPDIATTSIQDLDKFCTQYQHDMEADDMPEILDSLLGQAGASKIVTDTITEAIDNTTIDGDNVKSLLKIIDATFANLKTKSKLFEQMGSQFTLLDNPTEMTNTLVDMGCTDLQSQQIMDIIRSGNADKLNNLAKS